MLDFTYLIGDTREYASLDDNIWREVWWKGKNKEIGTKGKKLDDKDAKIDWVTIYGILTHLTQYVDWHKFINNKIIKNITLMLSYITQETQMSL